MLKKITTKKKALHISLKKSLQILEWVKRSVVSLKETFKKLRGQSSWTTTDSQQDILRAMLIFSCAWLDALFKQVFKDTLKILVEKDEWIKDELQKFLERKIKDEKNWIEIMSWCLLSDNPKLYIINSRWKDLWASSLQSQSQILEIHQKMNVKILDKQIIEELEILFKDRNHIIHEMDMIFGKKNRRQRTQPITYKQVEVLLKIWDNFLTEIDKKISK